MFGSLMLNHVPTRILLAGQYILRGDRMRKKMENEEELVLQGVVEIKKEREREREG